MSTELIAAGTLVEEDSQDAALRIEAASSNLPTDDIPATTPSASVIAVARAISDLTIVPYPKHIRRPKLELNTNARNRKFRYDREFLLQFMPICTKLNGTILEFTPPAAPPRIINDSRPARLLPLHVPKTTFGIADRDSPKLTALLNKLTMDKFDSVSDQIVELVNKSEEDDGHTLIQLIRLVFEKAADDANSSAMYARFCMKTMEQISPTMQISNIRNAEGKPVIGERLFRRCLLTRCGDDFQRCWAAKKAAASAAAEATGQQGNESDDVSAAQKAKRQWLDLIKFISELFKLGMLTEGIVHKCVRRLLDNENMVNPDEDEIESLCMFFSTIGSLLDTQKAQAHMAVYFSRMEELAKRDDVGSHMRLMLQDVIELRDRKWLHCSVLDVKAPSFDDGRTTRKLD